VSVRTFTLVGLLATLAVAMLAEDAQAQLFRRRRGSAEAVATPTYGGSSYGYAPGSGYAVAGGCDCCGSGGVPMPTTPGAVSGETSPITAAGGTPAVTAAGGTPSGVGVTGSPQLMPGSGNIPPTNVGGVAPAGASPGGYSPSYYQPGYFTGRVTPGGYTPSYYQPGYFTGGAAPAGYSGGGVVQTGYYPSGSYGTYPAYYGTTPGVYTGRRFGGRLFR
jgi:hypothetical protein